MEEAGSSNLPQPTNFPANKSLSGVFFPLESDQDELDTVGSTSERGADTPVDKPIV